MGMFDDIKCSYELPVKELIGQWFQTKDFACELDKYEIRKDGTLWKRHCDYEDRSDPKAEGILRMKGMMTPVNKKWHREYYTGGIHFYTLYGKSDRGWAEFSAYFRKGKITELDTIEIRDDCTLPENKPSNEKAVTKP